MNDESVKNARLFASMASVTVTPSTTADKSSSIIRFDPDHAKSVPGIIKIAEALTSLVGFICVQSIFLASYISAGGWYSFVAMAGFWIPLLIFLSYLFHIVEKLQWLPWLIIETGFAAIWSAFFFIAACVAASNGRLDPGWGAAAFFGFLAMFIFGYEAFIKYRSWKGGDPAQGDKQASGNPESNTTGPSYPTY